MTSGAESGVVECHLPTFPVLDVHEVVQVAIDAQDRYPHYRFIYTHRHIRVDLPPRKQA